MNVEFDVALPREWTWSAIKFCTTFLNRGTAPAYVDDGPVRAVGQAANQPDGLDWERTRFHDYGGDPKHLRGYLLPGDVLINSTGTGTLGRVGCFTSGPDDRPCVADGHVTVARADAEVTDSRYLYYWLGSTQFHDYIYSSMVVGATNQIELSRERLAAAPIALPPLDEQRRIANFLDAETAKIDDVLLARKRYRRLLGERLDCSLVTVFLADEAPERNLTRLKHLFDSARNGIWGDEATGDEQDLTCVRVADFVRDEYRADRDAPTVRNVAPSLARNRLLRTGDVLLEKSGGGDQSPVGYTVTFDSGKKSVCSNFVAALRVSDGVDPRFACLLLAAHYRSGRNIPYIKQTTGIQNLDSDGYLSQEAKIPSYEEQTALARRFDQELDDAAALRSAIDRQLALLAERRQALITAGVTGQIDVTTAIGVCTRGGVSA